jgi:hypothetical protein
LYFEQGDGEIFIYYDIAAKTLKMVTCIDITSLYREKRGKALSVVNCMSKIRHQNITHIYGHYVVEERFIYVEMEAPENAS